MVKRDFVVPARGTIETPELTNTVQWAEDVRATKRYRTENTMLVKIIDSLYRSSLVQLICAGLFGCQGGGI